MSILIIFIHIFEIEYDLKEIVSLSCVNNTREDKELENTLDLEMLLGK